MQKILLFYLENISHQYPFPNLQLISHGQNIPNLQILHSLGQFLFAHHVLFEFHHMLVKFHHLHSPMQRYLLILLR